MDTVTCTVCGKSMDEKDAYAKPTHRNHTYHICCPICLQLFQRNRERYTSGKKDDTVRW